MLVNCSNCRTPLQLPPGATSIRCAICQAITRIADPRSAAPAPPPAYLPTTSSYNGYNTNNYYPPPPPQSQPAPPPPSPYNHAPPGPPPAAHGRKKAVIVGISYRNSRNELKGCINDAKCMKYMLINRFKFPESSIIMLTGN